MKDALFLTAPNARQRINARSASIKHFCPNHLENVNNVLSRIALNVRAYFVVLNAIQQINTFCRAINAENVISLAGCFVWKIAAQFWKSVIPRELSSLQGW